MTTMRFSVIALLAGLLAACTSVEGTYYPGCPAFAGSKIVLGKRDFSWDQFTDLVLIDNSGNATDQFPDFPKHGSYERDGQFLRMTFAADGSVDTLHVRQHDGRLLLLTDTDLEEWQRTGRYADCVLTRENSEGK